MLRFAVGMVSIALTGAIAVAATTPNTRPGTQSGGPVRIDSCDSYLQDDLEHLRAGFTNTSDTTLVRIRIRFEYYDASGAQVGEVAVEDDGTFSPGSSIPDTAPYGEWTFTSNAIPWRPKTAKVICSIEKTVDGSGRVWAID